MTDVCPICGGSRKTGTRPLLFGGLYLGDFRSWECRSCGEVVFEAKAWGVLKQAEESLNPTQDCSAIVCDVRVWIELDVPGQVAEDTLSEMPGSTLSVQAEGALTLSKSPRWETALVPIAASI